MTFPLFPDQASTTAAEVDSIYLFLVGMSAFFIVIIFFPMACFLFRYRRGQVVNRTPVRLPTNQIELTWIIIPLLLTLAIFAWGANIYVRMQRAPQDALEIHVVGKQWMWKVQHQSGNREINELHVPVGRAVKLLMASEDVIHSFYLPAFRVKQDVVPGRYTTLWFQPTRVGTYHLFCAEYCGTDHSRMRGTVFVMEPSEYEAWLAAGFPDEPLVQSGARLFRELGCSGCHIGGMQVRAPRLEGLYGKPVPLQSGRIVQADEQYLRDSILLPNRHIAAGYEPLMPTFEGRVNQEQLLQLVSYLKSLGRRQPEPERQ